jgi:hypothetical protein
VGGWLHERALAWSVELLYPVGWYLNRVDISPQQLLHILWTIGPIYLVRHIDCQLETDWDAGSSCTFRKRANLDEYQMNGGS